jgi:hypothetical protein
MKVFALFPADIRGFGGHHGKVADSVMIRFYARQELTDDTNLCPAPLF